MNVQTVQSMTALAPAAVVVVPFFENDDLRDVPHLAEIGGRQLSGAMERGEVRARPYSQDLFHSAGDAPALLVIGAGAASDFSPLIQMRVAAAAARHLTGHGYTEIGVVDRAHGQAADFARSAVEGLILGAYNADLLKTNPQVRRELKDIYLVSRRSSEELKSGAEEGRVVGEARNLARDLVNLPPNELTPSSLAARAATLAHEMGLKFEVLDQDGMQVRGMGSLLGVAAGSDQPPRLIVLRYGPQDAAIRLALVGKGLTFDSGGLSLKPAQSMETMKSDMGGAAAVIAGIAAIAQLGMTNIGITAYVGATENMPGGGAMRPGDVMTAMNGETIEVLNTDAEGRLVLADVLSYAVQDHATHIIDFATLTGGATVALGHAATLATGRPGDWVERVVAAADRGLDRAWPMPLFPEYRKAMESQIADIKNTGGRAASALTAASFLGDFVDSVPWAHMDIAGTAFEEDSVAYRAKGGTGVGVGTIVSLARYLNGENGVS